MKRFITIIVLIFLFNCDGPEKPKKPDNLISKDKMITILYDAYVLNAAKASNRRTLELNGIYPETYLYEKHKIDSTQFADSNAYYAYDTESYKNIISAVKSKISKEKEDYDNQLKAEAEAKKKKQDSIKAARKKRSDSISKAQKGSKSKLIKTVVKPKS